MLPKKRRRKKRHALVLILFLLFGALFAVSSFVIARHLIDSEQDKKALKNLSATATQAQQAAEIEGLFGLVSLVPKPQTQQITVYTDSDHAESSNADSPDAEEVQYTEYAVLYEQNSDFVGWLHIENTNVDCPVMCTPDEPEYYLHRAFDRSESQGGTPFVSKDSTIDSDFYIIYGHNMKNDTMFGTLDNYAKKAFWEENSTFSFTTVTEYREYEVFAVLKTRVLYQDETGYRYYYQVGDLTEDAYDGLISWFRQNALYDTGITPTYGEQIVVLSTCSYHESNGRFIVAARRINNAE